MPDSLHIVCPACLAVNRVPAAHWARRTLCAGCSNSFNGGIRRLPPGKEVP